MPYDYHLYFHQQISYTPSSGYVDGVVSNGHYELYPSENNLVLALVAMMKRFKWSQMSILTQNEQPFVKVIDVFYYR